MKISLKKLAKMCNQNDEGVFNKLLKLKLFISCAFPADNAVGSTVGEKLKHAFARYFEG